MPSSKAAAKPKFRFTEDQLGNFLLASILGFSGMVQLSKALDALTGGDRWLALYQALVGVSIVIMAALLVVRRPAIAKRAGWRPKAVAAIGSFIMVPLGTMSLTWHPSWLLAATSGVLIFSYVWIIWALLTLRRSFSVFPEARELITHGPYKWVRHPLYAAYFLTYLCSVLPRIGVLSLAILVIGISAEVIRSHDEERVITSVYPEYRAYAARVSAFFPHEALLRLFAKRSAWQPSKLSARRS